MSAPTTQITGTTAITSGVAALTLTAVGNSLSLNVDIGSDISLVVSLPQIRTDVNVAVPGLSPQLLSADVSLGSVGVSLGSVQMSLINSLLTLQQDALNREVIWQAEGLATLAGVGTVIVGQILTLEGVVQDEIAGLNLSLVAELEEQTGSQERAVTLASLLVATLAAQYAAQTVAAAQAQSAAVSALFKQNASGVNLATQLSAVISVRDILRSQSVVLRNLLSANITLAPLATSRNAILNSLRIDNALSRVAIFNSAHALATLVTIQRQLKTVALSANVLAATANAFLADISTAILAGNAVSRGAGLDIATLTALAAVRNANLSAVSALLSTGNVNNRADLREIRDRASRLTLLAQQRNDLLLSLVVQGNRSLAVTLDNGELVTLSRSALSLASVIVGWQGSLYAQDTRGWGAAIQGIVDGNSDYIAQEGVSRRFWGTSTFRASLVGGGVSLSLTGGGGLSENFVSTLLLGADGGAGINTSLQGVITGITNFSLTSPSGLFTSTLANARVSASLRIAGNSAFTATVYRGGRPINTLTSFFGAAIDSATLPYAPVGITLPTAPSTTTRAISLTSATEASALVGSVNPNGRKG